MIRISFRLAVVSLALALWGTMGMAHGFVPTVGSHGGVFNPPPPELGPERAPRPTTPYGGPGDTTPRNPGPASPGGPSSPAGPGKAPKGEPTPAGPDSPGPGAPKGNPQGPAGPAGPSTPEYSELADPTTWQYWWNHNQHPYLGLKARLHMDLNSTDGEDWLISKGSSAQQGYSSRPTAEQMRSQVIPALVAALGEKEGNDLATGCLMALAKVGQGRAAELEMDLAGIIRPFVQSGTQEISETAVVALGILGEPSSVEFLVQLMLDGPSGRSYIGKVQVPIRTRAFAAYGLGLIASRAETSNDVRIRIANVLVEVLGIPLFLPSATSRWRPCPPLV